MTSEPALTAEELDTVARILADCLPGGYQAFVFGSRAAGGRKLKPWSDLDLSLEGPGPLPLGTLAELADAFDRSPLPWKVDLVDRAAVSTEFGAIIDRQKVPLPSRQPL